MANVLLSSHCNCDYVLHVEFHTLNKAYDYAIFLIVKCLASLP
jgi:hypothetical protein